VLLQVVGGLVVLLVGQDVFFTVLFPRSGHGALRKPLSRGVWRLMRWVAAHSGTYRRRVLAYAGPVLITVTLLAWGLLLVVGWALIAQPALGSGIRASSGPTDTSWATAIYYSGYALTTLGTGDLVPQTGPYRLMIVSEASMGFVTLTMVITYFLSVYTSLTSRNTVASVVNHRTRGTGDAAVLLTGMTTRAGDLSGVQDNLDSLGSFMLQILQTHQAYPVLRYFHFREHYYALPRLIFVTLDAATLVAAATDQADSVSGVAEPADRVIAPAVLAEAWGGACDLLDEVSRHIGLVRLPRAEQSRIDQWRQRYHRAAPALAAARIQPAHEDQQEAAALRYAELRGAWDPRLRSLAQAMLCSWDDIEPSAP
jgi:hypothetical protein